MAVPADKFLTATITSRLFLDTSARIGVDGGAALTSTGVISGPATSEFRKMGGGNLILDAANNYVGSTVVAQGTLTVRQPAALGTTAATNAAWRTTTVYRYGRTETVQLAQVACIWYGSFGNTLGRCVLVRELGSTKAYDLALFTLDQTATPAQIVERYAMRWSIEPTNAVGKQQMGVGQARNRVKNAVERTVPFGMLIQSLVVVWYALHGHHPDDALVRRLAQPWYQTKTEPSFEDMITKLRKTLIVARFTPDSPGQPNPDLLHDYALACAAAAA